MKYCPDMVETKFPKVCCVGLEGEITVHCVRSDPKCCNSL